MMVAHRLIRVQRERIERMLITQRSMRMVILQRESDSGAHINKSSDIAERV